MLRGWLSILSIADRASSKRMAPYIKPPLVKVCFAREQRTLIGRILLSYFRRIIDFPLAQIKHTANYLESFLRKGLIAHTYIYKLAKYVDVQEEVRAALVKTNTTNSLTNANKTSRSGAKSTLFAPQLIMIKNAQWNIFTKWNDTNSFIFRFFA